MQSQNREFGSWLEGQQDVLLPGLLALDLGCGTGDDARYMMDAGLRVIGLDLSPQRVARAAARAPGALFIVGNLADGLPLRSSIADLAIAHPMVLAVSVRIEKPQAIPEAQAAGVEIIRRKS